MNAAAGTAGRIPPTFLRRVFKRDARKRLAGAFDIAVRTAKDYLIDGAPLARREQLARAIEQELARIEREADDLRKARDLLREPHEVSHPEAAAVADAAMALAQKLAAWGRS